MGDAVRTEMGMTALCVRIACVFDDAYAPHFATLASSLALTKGPEMLHVTLVSGPELSEATAATVVAHLEKLDIVCVRLRVPSAMLDTLPPAGTYPPLIWYRLLLPDLLPGHERVLYLDADMLALQSLLPLYLHDLGDNLLGAVAQPTIGLEAHCRALGLEPQLGYFNSGTLLMNLVRMRAEGFTASALARAKNNTLRFPDQDLLNITTAGRWAKLAPKWNAVSYLWLDPLAADGMYGSLEREIALRAPALVHFEGPGSLKPWHFRSLHPLREVYRELRAQTPWPLVELEGRSWIAALLRSLPLRWQYWISQTRQRISKALRG